MRRGIFGITSGVALVAFMALSAPAFGVIDDRCDGSPYPNDFAAHDFRIATTGAGLQPSSDVEHQVAGISGGALVCGADYANGRWEGEPGAWERVYPGVETLPDNAKVDIPAGALVNTTAGLPNGSYLGSGQIHAASWTGRWRDPDHPPALVPTALAPLQQSFNVWSDSLSECQRENGLLADGPVAGMIITCIKGDTTGVIPGHSWNWHVVRPDGRLVLVIGPFYNDLPEQHPAGLTSIDFLTFCGYAGAVGVAGCGDGSVPSKWLQKNGDWSYAAKTYCKGVACIGEDDSGPSRTRSASGTYTVTVVNKGAEQTDPVSTFVSWKPNCVPATDGARSAFGSTTKQMAGTATSPTWYDVCPPGSTHAG